MHDESESYEYQHLLKVRQLHAEITIIKLTLVSKLSSCRSRLVTPMLKCKRDLAYALHATVVCTHEDRNARRLGTTSKVPVLLKPVA